MLAIYLLPIFLFAQREREEFIYFSDTGKCIFNTINSANSDGLEMKVYYPCLWQEFNENKKIPTLIKQFIHADNDSLTVGMTISISTSPIKLTDENIEKIRQPESLKILTEQYGDYFSSKIIKINGIRADEVVLSGRNINSKNRSFFVVYHLYYKSKIITLTYSLDAANSEALKHVLLYKIFFRKLINRTEIIN